MAKKHKAKKNKTDILTNTKWEKRKKLRISDYKSNYLH